MTSNTFGLPLSYLPYTSEPGNPHWEQEFFIFHSDDYLTFQNQRLGRYVYTLKDEYKVLQKYPITCEIVWLGNAEDNNRYYAIVVWDGDIWTESKEGVCITRVANRHNILNTNFMEKALRYRSKNI